MKYRVTDVRIKLLEHLLGTVPKDKEIFKTYIGTLKPSVEGEEENEEDNIKGIEERGWTGFMKDDEKGLFIYNYLVKGFLKEAGNVLKDQLKLKALRSKIDKVVFINPRKIFFGKMDPDGVLERSLRVMTPQGPRVTLVRSDYIKEGTEISFDISILDNKVVNKKEEIDEELISDLFEYGHFCGLGQFRNGSYGSFQLMEFKPRTK